MKKILPKVLIGLVVLFVVMQAIRPEQTNPPVTGELATPPEVAVVLRKACYDCHSNETKWPWYSQVAPVSWLVTRDVNEGRKHLNFSVWNSYEDKRKAKKFEGIAEEVSEGGMPMAIYPPLHPEAKLTDAEKALVVEWAKKGGG